MFKAKDFMTSVVITTRPEMPIYDAIRLLANRNVTGLPVVDAELNLVGMLCEKDVLKTMYATEESADQTVADYMATDFTTFDVNSSLIDMCDHFVENDSRRVPITEDGMLVGVVAIRNIINAILTFEHQAATC
jgi:CBS domain-containing protein